MEFRTTLHPFSLPFEIDLKDSLFFIGSCFAENVSQRFSSKKFGVTSNPFGTLYNPLSISLALNHIANKKDYDSSTQIKNQGIYYSWLHHGSLAALSSEELLKKTNNINLENFEKLQKCSYLFITLGSAWAYKHKKTGLITANCHKVAADQFEKVFINCDEIVKSFENSIQAIKKINHQVKIVLTVSPVRHIRDGLIQNNRSKAELIQAVHKLCDAHNLCYYLPVYEWVIDDLRDYRFYEKDLVHPNNMAQDYIWENIDDLFFTEHTKGHLKRINNFISGLEHKAFNPNSEEHISFLKNLLNKGKKLEKELNINLQVELLEIETRLKIIK